MASTSNQVSFDNITCFPSVVNGQININNFLEAAADLVSLVGTYHVNPLFIASL